MSLKGKPVCAQNLFRSLLRDPRKTQPWVAVQMMWPWPSQAASGQSCGVGFAGSSVFPTLRTVGWGPWAELECSCGDPARKIKLQIRIQVNRVDGSVCTSCAKWSQQLLQVLLNTQKLLLADDSKHNCSPRQVKEFVCSDNMISLDFLGFLYCRACRAQTIPRYSQLSHFDALQLPRGSFLVPWMNFLELSALNFPFSEVVFKMLHFCELFTDNFGAIKQSWVCCRKSQHKRIFSATDIFSTVLSSGFFSASVSSSQNKAIFHYYLFICTDFQQDWSSTLTSHTHKKCPHTGLLQIQKV